MTCAIIDDEPLAVRLLESYVAKTPFLEHCGSYHSAVEALDALQAAPVDLLFLDIQMPGLDGLDFARMLGTPTRIVFTTAFREYAVDSYKVNAADYLLKPIAYADFLSAAIKVRDAVAQAQPQPQPSAPAPAAAGEEGALRSFFVKSDYRLLRIDVDDVLYVEGLKDYVKIYLASTPRPVISLTSMKAVEAYLPATHFLRTHRSYIVNMQRADALERGQVIYGEKRIPVSDSYREQVQDYINRHMLQGRSGMTI